MEMKTMFKAFLIVLNYTYEHRKSFIDIEILQNKSTQVECIDIVETGRKE